ncbi:hypothetical protein HPB50_025456 [Hyalomma asiaticum]|uniref:Uncharacterized protein n=1 Tax=Hyalomma asiaticum TaxID=266040 RepID=A0ACB7RL94_HYAAI|nr:hypothetical protein HPB50_025456 [Hyalomma asiaticum]
MILNREPVKLSFLQQLHVFPRVCTSVTLSGNDLRAFVVVVEDATPSQRRLVPTSTRTQLTAECHPPPSQPKCL